MGKRFISNFLCNWLKIEHKLIILVGVVSKSADDQRDSWTSVAEKFFNLKCEVMCFLSFLRTSNQNWLVLLPIPSLAQSNEGEKNSIHNIASKADL